MRQAIILETAYMAQQYALKSFRELITCLQHSSKERATMFGKSENFSNWKGMLVQDHLPWLLPALDAASLCLQVQLGLRSCLRQEKAPCVCSTESERCSENRDSKPATWGQDQATAMNQARELSSHGTRLICGTWLG